MKKKEGIKIEDRKSIKIRSVKANSVYRVNNNIKYTDSDGEEHESRLITGDAVMNDSLFIRHMYKSVNINKKGYTYDFVLLDFVKCKRELREEYYKHGITIPWPIYDKNGNKIGTTDIHYKMLMRSPGKAKKGQCIFVMDKLHKKALDYLTMGLYDKMPEDNAKIVELSAYQTLVTASAIGYINIPLDNILIIEDQEVRSNFPVWSVEIQDGKCVVNRQSKHQEVVNVLFDGEGLVDESVFTDNNLDDMDGFIYCRSHFFKACLFRANVQAFFRDQFESDEEYENATVQDMFGYTHRLKDIKVVTTNNAIKWLKFVDIMSKRGTLKRAYQYYKSRMRKTDNTFSIVKTGHKSKWGDVQRSSYQINNSLPIITDDIENTRDILRDIGQTSIDFCDRLKDDHTFFMDYLKQEACAYNINDILIALDNWNDKFKDTKYFRSKKSKMISKLKTEMQLGRVLQNGDNLTICGNPIALLLKAMGKDYKDEGCFEVEKDAIECYTRRFDEGEYLAGFRSPHNAPNNIVHLHNVYPDKIIKYLPNLGDSVIVINGIGTDVQMRLNGQDLDSDSVFVTNQKQIVNAARIAYSDYPTIINNIPLLGSSKYKKDARSYAAMDNSISSGQMTIGYSSNLAQMALCYYYDKLYQTGEKSKDLEDIFAICAVLAQCAIDSAKRIYAVNVSAELNKMRNIQCMRDYCEEIKDDEETADDEEMPTGFKVPRFYAENQKARGNDESKVIIDDSILCPMQMLYEIIDSEVKDADKNPTVKFDEVFKYTYNPKVKRDNRKQLKRIIRLIFNYDTRVRTVNTITYKDSHDRHEKRMSCFEKEFDQIKKLKINQDTMSYLINFAFKNTDICDSILIFLYRYNPNMFLNCFKKSQK